MEAQEVSADCSWDDHAVFSTHVERAESGVFSRAKKNNRNTLTDAEHDVFSPRCH
jgi:hypothetical protein